MGQQRDREFQIKQGGMVEVFDLAAGTSLQGEWLLDHQLCLVTADGCPWRSDPDVLRPDGWGPLRLGMTREEVVETTGAEESRTAGTCTSVDLRPGGLGLLSDEDARVGELAAQSLVDLDSPGIAALHEVAERTSDEDDVTRAATSYGMALLELRAGAGTGGR